MGWLSMDDPSTFVVSFPSADACAPGRRTRSGDSELCRRHGLYSRCKTMARGFQNPERSMLCSLCKHGETAPGLVTVTLTRGDTVVVLKGVPGEVCDNCSEYYLDTATAERLYQQADAAVARRVEVEVLRYTA